MEYKKLSAAIAEIPDEDGKIIPVDVLKEAARKYSKKIGEEIDCKFLFRRGGDPNFISEVAGIIHDVGYDEDTKQVFIDVDFLDNANGKVAKDLLQAGIPLHASFSASYISQKKEYNYLDFSHFYLSYMPPNGAKFVEDFSEE